MRGEPRGVSISETTPEPGFIVLYYHTAKKPNFISSGVNALQLKQFIVAFLLLAIVAGSSAFIFSDLGAGGSVPKKEIAKSTDEQQSAFVEQLSEGDIAAMHPDVNGADDADSSTGSDANGNLTENLVALLGQGLDDANPTGPIGSDGQPRLLVPDTNAIVATLENDISIAATIPDWEADVAFRNQVRLVAGNSPKDIATYKEKRDALLNAYFSGLPTLTDGTQPIEAEALSPGAVLATAQNIPVPIALIDYHRSLVKLLSYEEKALKLSAMSDTDPLRATLIMRVQEANYMGAVARFELETQKAVALGLSPSVEVANAGSPSLFAAAFGIQTAHAAWIHVDPVKLAREIWTFLQRLITEKLKDILVHKLVQQTIRWIQGGGKPQFITNWKGFLKDSGKRAVDIAISDLYPQLCQPFAPLIRVAVLPVDFDRNLPGTSPITCTLDQIVGNVKAFSDSFTNGGWVAYGAALEPSNNFFGALIQANDIVQARAAAERAAKERAVKAGKGGLPQQECVQYEQGSTYGACVDQVYAQCAAQNFTSDECDEQILLICGNLSDTQQCLEWRDTTPGSVILGSLSDTVRAPLERIVNADDFVALVNALINAMLSKLTQLGRDAISGGILALNPDDAYVGPGATDYTQGGQEGRQPPVVPGYPPVGTPTTSSTPPTGTATFRNQVISAVASCAASFGVQDASCGGNGTPNYRTNVGAGQAYVQCVADTLNASGLTAIKDPNAGEGDEVAVKQSNAFSENYDVLVGSGGGGGCVNTRHLSTETPAWF